MGWLLLLNALRPLKIYCASPNLGITNTWIRRLNFAQRPIFTGSLTSLNLRPSRRTCAKDFYVLKKSIDLGRIWTRKPWVSRRARYPEPSRPTINKITNQSVSSTVFIINFTILTYWHFFVGERTPFLEILVNTQIFKISIWKTKFLPLFLQLASWQVQNHVSLHYGLWIIWRILTEWVSLNITMTKIL